MRTGALVVCLMVLATLASACNAPPEVDDADPPVPSPPPPLPSMTQTGCGAFYSRHVAGTDWSTQRLPAGLAPYPFSELGKSGTMFMVKAWSCEESEIDNVSAGPTKTFLFYIAVTPDAAYANDTQVFYWFPLHILTDNERLMQTFRAWDMPADLGTVAIERSNTQDAFPTTITADGNGTTAELTHQSGSRSDGEAFSVRYFGSDAGRVSRAVDIEVQAGRRAGGGPTALDLAGPHSPFNRAEPGVSSLQAWEPEKLSYVWTPLEFGVELA